MGKKVYTGNEAWEKFGEKLSEIGELETPMFPFRAGRIQYYNLSGESDIPKYGYYRFEKYDTELIGKTVGFPLTMEKLTVYLAKNCNVQNPQDYSWPLIFAALEQSGKNPEQKNKPVKDPLKKETISAESKLLGILAVNADKIVKGERSLNWITNQAGVSRTWANKCLMFKATYNKLKPPKIPKKGKGYSFDDNRDSKKGVSNFDKPEYNKTETRGSYDETDNKDS
jgi:hypothetical protein